VAGALALALSGVAVVVAQGTPPGAPGNLTYQVSGGTVWLNWIASTGMTESFNPNTSFYRLEAGASPGTTFFTWDSAQLNDPGKMPHLLASFSTAGVAPGTYYVRVRGVNQGAVGPPSNEVAVPVTGGCQIPAAPTDVTAIMRGNMLFMAWNPGNGGSPSSYVVHAAASPGGAPIAVLGTSGAYLNVNPVPNGVYHVVVYAVSPCGTSPASTEIVVAAPFNSPARTPNAASGKLPWLYVRDVVFQASAAASGLRDGQISCPQRPGFPWLNYPIPNPTPEEADIIERQKTQRNPYIDAVVAYLRQLDTRFGYNAKPTRANVNSIIAGDEIAYHWGSDAPEGSPNVYLIDVLGGHCTFRNEVADHRPFFNEYGRWTAAGAF
jgi:hypothetical protein